MKKFCRLYSARALFLLLALLSLIQINGYADIFQRHESSLFKANANLPPKEKGDRILFVVPRMIAGGMERAFISMLNNFPVENMELHIAILKRGGDFEALLPAKVKIIDLEEAKKTSYSTVVSYAQWIDPALWTSIETKKRIQWIHSDAKFDIRHRSFKRMMKQKSLFDHIICVSKDAIVNFESAFPKASPKLSLICNIIDNQHIKDMAEREDVSSEMPESQMPKVLTVARLSHEKQIDLAIKAHAHLKNQGIHFTWYVIGEGPEREKLEGLIQEYKLEDRFILLGRRENPYPYMKRADVFSLLSKTEGFGLVVTEAKILQKPILVANFKAAYEQINSGVNGLIVEGDVESVAQGLKRLILDASLRGQFSRELRGFEYNNSESLSSLKQLFSQKPKKLAQKRGKKK